MNDLRYQVDLLNIMNNKLSNQERIFKLLIDHSDHAYIYISLETNEVQTMGLFSDFFDFEIKSVGDLGYLINAVDESCAEILNDCLYPEKNNKQSDNIEVSAKNGKVWYTVEVALIFDEAGKAVDKIIKFTDVTIEHEKKNEVLFLAYYDSLTGIYNRTYFIELLGKFIDKAKERNESVAVINIDIDDFKKVNDGLGMMTGDEILMKFGAFIKEFENDRVIVSHLSNDIFSIAIYNPIGEYSVECYRKKVLKKLETPFKSSNGLEVSITVSMSAAEYPEAADSALDLISCADIVMYKCKSMGKNQFKYFDSAILDEFLTGVDLEKQLNDAVLKNRFVVYFQPQYHSETRKLRGMEALVRWRNEEKGMIPPGVFIPLAEKNGTIISIGKFVLEESVRRYANWKKIYGVDFIMSINISALQYKRDDFVETVKTIIKKYDVPPENIELEITESILIDDFDAVTAKLIELRNFGVKISLDDFGTGYSSLSYLKKFPIDTLKIDKSFIDTVLIDKPTRIITESILDMTRNMGFESIAEGVESEAQYNYLNEAGCDVIQGYFFGKPTPAESIDGLLAMISG